MALTDQQLLDALSRMPFVESTELALILGEPHATVHRRLSELLAEGIVGKATHGTVHLPSSSMSIPRNIEPQYPLTLSQIPRVFEPP